MDLISVTSSIRRFARPMEPIERIIVGAQVLRQPAMPSNGTVEHPTECDGLRERARTYNATGCLCSTVWNLRNVLPGTRVSPPESSRSANCVSFGSTRGITSLVRLHGIFVRDNRTADNVRRKNRGGAPCGGARWKNCAGASQARPGMISRQSTAYPDEEQRDSTCVTTVPPKWPMTAWGTACGDYFRVTTRKLARPLNTRAFINT
jgi:hypothetical protein